MPTMPPSSPIHLKLLIFTRYPGPGQAKSRLIPALGAEEAARLQRRMSEATVQTARRLRNILQDSEVVEATVRICYTGGRAASFRAWLGEDLEYQRQADGDLGRRLQQAFELAFRPRLAHQSCDGQECGTPLKDRRLGNEIEMTLAVGSDVPRLTAELLREAMKKLTTHDLVLGPAEDGGYYLLGLKEPQPELFRNIKWGSDQVAAQTSAAAARLGLTTAFLPPLPDIDRPADLTALAADERFADFFGQPPRLSVIIPTLNEAAVLPSTLEHLQQAASRPGSEIEIIVADGGSHDQTRQLARSFGATVIEATRGRAAQLNAAAAEARGQALLFLHADTVPPRDFPVLIFQTLADPTTVAGAFSLQIDAAGALLRLLERGANLRARLLGLPYGDQGIFLNKRVFEEMGGFPPLPIMEDFQLVRWLARRGRVVIRPEKARTSARRWRQHGVLRTFLINQVMVLGFWLGISPDRLARFYRNQR